jgi:hypothetical protein
MNRTTGLCFAAITIIAHEHVAVAQQAPAPPPVPPYTAVRWNEDYSYLKTAPRDADPFDPLKYIPFGDNAYLSLGAQVRYRYEYFNNTNFGDGFEDNDGYHLIRILAHADLHLGDNFRFFVQGKSALIEDGGIGAGGAPRGPDADELDLQQAFADFRIPLAEKDSLIIRAGRQDLIYGAQRLIGPLDWTNARRTFEGAKVSLVRGKHALDAFWVRPVNVEKEEFNNGNGDISFAGLYDTIQFPDLIRPGDKSRLELYGLIFNSTDATFAQNASTGPEDEDRYTIGARFYANPKPFDFDVEAAYQFGKFGSGDISAWMVASEAGFTFDDAPLKPRPFLAFDFASGDDDPTDEDLETFNQLFPTGHLFFGYADVVGRQNILDAHGGVDLKLLDNKRCAKNVTLRLEQHFFWRADTSDALYGVGAGAASMPPVAGITRGAGGSDASYVGSEFDLLLSWQFDRHLAAYVGYSHVFAGDFIEETGPSSDIDFVYAALVFTF